MKGIRFGGLHSYDDLGLVLGKKELGAPAVKDYKTDVPGADGSLDQTEFFGELPFSTMYAIISSSLIAAGLSSKLFSAT